MKFCCPGSVANRQKLINDHIVTTWCRLVNKAEHIGHWNAVNFSRRLLFSMRYARLVIEMRLNSCLTPQSVPSTPIVTAALCYLFRLTESLKTSQQRRGEVFSHGRACQTAPLFSISIAEPLFSKSFRVIDFHCNAPSCSSRKDSFYQEARYMSQKWPLGYGNAQRWCGNVPWLLP